MRESLKEYEFSEEILKITITKMNFYSEYFGYLFPFKKYDQIFCPEYICGAIENVALVIINEAYCFKKIYTKILTQKSNHNFTWIISYVIWIYGQYKMMG